MGLMRNESLEEEYSKILDDLGFAIDEKIEREENNENEEKQKR